jgi:hypothetical protein
MRPYVMLIFLAACANSTDTDNEENTGNQDTDVEDSGAKTTETDCANGVDDDRDGLVDCEDADCFSSDCTETCDDGHDNDGDSLIDCLDDDCWGLSCDHPHGVKAWVTSGEVPKQILIDGTFEYRKCNGNYGKGDCRGGVLYGENIQGQVQVQSPSAEGWSGATTTCEWSVGAVVFGSGSCFGTVNGSAYIDLQTSPPVRQNTYVEPGCRLYDVGFLPTTLTLVPAGAAINSSVIWYGGNKEMNFSMDRDHVYNEPCSNGGSTFSKSYSSMQSFSLDPTSGDAFTFTGK